MSSVAQRGAWDWTFPEASDHFTWWFKCTTSCVYYLSGGVQVSKLYTLDSPVWVSIIRVISQSVGHCVGDTPLTNPTYFLLSSSSVVICHDQYRKWTIASPMDFEIHSVKAHWQVHISGVSLRGGLLLWNCSCAPWAPMSAWYPATVCEEEILPLCLESIAQLLPISSVFTAVFITFLKIKIRITVPSLFQTSVFIQLYFCVFSTSL